MVLGKPQTKQKKIGGDVEKKVKYTLSIIILNIRNVLTQMWYFQNLKKLFKKVSVSSSRTQKCKA